MKVMTIVGARPQFIKAAVVSRVFRTMQSVTEVMVHTGQHYDENMSEVFFQELEIDPPKYNLAVGSASHAAQTAQMLIDIEQVCLKEKPDVLLIYGDTNSTLAGALVAAKLHISIAHVEAGLRSFNQLMPEEVNRILSDQVSKWLFTPTQQATQQLKLEGVNEQKIHQVGDVMYDVSLVYGEKAEQTSQVLEKLELKDKDYILVTIHRAENTDNKQRLFAIFNGLMEIAQDTQVILPLHPRTKKVLAEHGLLQQVERQLTCLAPLGFLDMLQIEKQAKLIVTDSGGVQKEAYFYRVPCVTLRDETEWVELVEHGWNHLLPPQTQAQVVTGIKQALSAPSGEEKEFYGDGQAAEKIVEVLMKSKMAVRENKKEDTAETTV